MSNFILLRYGLANRLRTMAGYIYISKQLNKQFIFHWDTTHVDCNGNFDDIFEPIDGITIVDRARDLNINYYFIGQDTVSNILKKEICHGNVKEVEDEIYSLFVLKEEIAREINLFPAPAAAIHVRRTDHVELACNKSRYTDDNQFIDFIKQHREVFLATDCHETQKYYLQFENVIIWRAISPPANSKYRQTSLKDAVIDAYIATRAEYFMGTDYSSFSELIRILQRIEK